MKNIDLDKILDMVNDVKIKMGLENYVPLYPMLRVENNKLFIVVMLLKDGIDVWNSKIKVIADYWCKIDIETLEVLEFNELHNDDNIKMGLIAEDNDMNKLVEKKHNQYIEYLMNDVINTVVSSDDLLNSLNNEVIMKDEKMISIEEYLKENIESMVNFKAKEFVDMIIQAKYSLMLVSYNSLFNVVRNEYLQKQLIIGDKIKLCLGIMQKYYSNILSINEIFNI